MILIVHSFRVCPCDHLQRACGVCRQALGARNAAVIRYDLIQQVACGVVDLKHRAGEQGACREPRQFVVFRRPFRDDDLACLHGVLPCDLRCFPFLHIECFHAVVGKAALCRFDLTQLVLALRQLPAYPDIALFVTESIFLISTEEAGAFVAFSVVRFPSCISTSFASLSCI